jgi:hypothetical protein
MQETKKIQEGIAVALSARDDASEINLLAEIGHITKLIVGLALTNELQACAFEYGLVKVGTLAEELLIKSKHTDLLKKFSDEYQCNNLKEILAEFVQIRNCLADNFHRLNPAEHNKFLAMKDNKILMWFANPIKLNTPFDNISLAEIQSFKDFNKMLEKNRGMNTLNKLGCMSFYLAKIQNFCVADKKLETEEVRSAISMLLITTGTCAREGRRDKSLALPESLDTYTEVRNLLAHLYCFARKNEAWQITLCNTVGDVEKKLMKINKLILSGEKYLQIECKRPEALNSRPPYQVQTPVAQSSIAQILHALPSVLKPGAPTPSVDVDAEYDKFMAEIAGANVSSSKAPAAAAVSSPASSATTDSHKRAKEEAEKETVKKKKEDEGGLKEKEKPGHLFN